MIVEPNDVVVVTPVALAGQDGPRNATLQRYLMSLADDFFVIFMVTLVTSEKLQLLVDMLDIPTFN